jgi:hypothetical protein
MVRAEVRGKTIAGGFVLVPVASLIGAWRGCRSAPLGIGDFRAWLACHEMKARRCVVQEGRAPTYAYAELARLTGVSEKRAKFSVNRLVGSGFLNWSDQVIGFPEPDTQDDSLADTIGGGKGSLAIPRRMLRFLVTGARPALIATVLAILLRCLSRGRGGFKSRGRVKASWIAQLFDVDLRRVKQARRELIDMGWIVPEETDQWCENRWGRAYSIDLSWDRIATPGGRRLPPPPAPDGRRLPPPDSDPEPLREDKNQEPASGGPAGFQIQEAAEEQIPQPSLPMPRATESSAIPAETTVVHAPSVAVKIEPACPPPALVATEARTSPSRVEPGRPALIRDGAGGTSLPAPTLNDVRVEDLKDTGRLLVLLAPAIARDLVGTSEADRLRFVAAAEHALTVGKGNPPGLFIYLIRGRLWRYLTQEDEDRASRRLKLHQFGPPREVGGGGLRPGAAMGPGQSEDARLVRELRGAMIRAGIFRDPFPALQARDPGWTRERWDAALAELEEVRSLS